jgi:hypothetical protein
METGAPTYEELMKQNEQLRAALELMIDHASEQYPHFESPRGQRDIAQARNALELSK